MKKTLPSVLAMLLISSFSIVQGLAQDSDWILFESPDKDFTILFPAQPVANPQVVNSEVGELKVTAYLYEASDYEKEDNLIYGVFSTEYPKSIFDDATEDTWKTFFRSSIDGAVQNVNGKLLSEKIITLGGYPGREIRINFRDGMAVIKMRLYLVNNKMYIIQTITDSRKDFNTAINQFLDSFKLTP